eukprot:gene8567-8749_t
MNVAADDSSQQDQDQASPAALVASQSCGSSETAEKGLFFARIPPSVSVDDIRAFFSSVAEVDECNLYKAWATAKTSKGCGVVMYKHSSGANAALEQLAGMQPWPDSVSPLVLERINLACMTPPASWSAKHPDPLDDQADEQHPLPHDQHQRYVAVPVADVLLLQLSTPDPPAAASQDPFPASGAADRRATLMTGDQATERAQLLSQAQAMSRVAPVMSPHVVGHLPALNQAALPVTPARLMLCLLQWEQAYFRPSTLDRQH